ncbi:MAG: isoprenylcysteine carboxyl methyltransferase family protein [Candidatus Acidiferrales bacterium]
MELSVWLYLALLGAAALGRVVEIFISRRNQRRLIAAGARRVPEAVFPWMVLLHAGVFAGAGLEVVFLHRPFLPFLGFSALAVFAFANVLRWWVIRTMAGHWNVQVMASTKLGVVTSGPFRWVRHPNYVAVVLELMALPLIHTAWLTALVATVANALVLWKRLSVEESVLLADPAYREAMGSKPRFLPGLF